MAGIEEERFRRRCEAKATRLLCQGIRGAIARVAHTDGRPIDVNPFGARLTDADRQRW